MNILELNGVSEEYRIKFLNAEGGVSWEEIWALNDINFSVKKGEVFGVIGHNGSGKTTLLKLIAGMLMPDKGKISIYGKVSALMEIGAGFNPEFTGRENILVNARMYGLEDDILEHAIKDIIDFADLGKFIDAPIKYYSQGMYMRLAFALAIFVKPDVFLIDDILAVGDEEAQQKCIKKVFELKHSGKTIVLVSHDMNMVTKLCDRVILLERGKVISEGPPDKVVPYYLETVGDKKGIASLRKSKLRAVFNNGRITLSYDGLLLTKGSGACVSFFAPSFNSYILSTSLYWRVKNTTVDRVVAQGLSYDGHISQVWTLELDDGRLKLAVEIKDDIKDSHVELFLVSDHNNWVTLDNSGNFPRFAHKTNWQDLNIGDCPEGVLGISSDSINANLPLVVFTNGDKSGQIKLFNTGYEQECHVVKLYASNNKLLAFDIRLFSEITSFESYLESLKNELNIKAQSENENKSISYVIAEGDVRLLADKESKAIRLYYKDKEITKGIGLHISFLEGKNWHDDLSADWQVSKDDNSLTVKLYWELFSLGITCKFKVGILGFFWHIDYYAVSGLDINALKFGIALKEAYKAFFCGYQQGELPDKFKRWQEVHLENPSAELLGFRKTESLPAIVFKNERNLSCVIQNSDLNTSCRFLQLALSDSGMLKAKNFSLDSQITILEDETMIDDYIAKSEKQLVAKEASVCRIPVSSSISCGDIILFADEKNKAIRIYYKDKEITRGSALHALFRISDEHFWVGFMDAEYSFKKNSESQMTVEFNQKYLSQVWNFEFKEDSVLEFSVDLEINKPIFLSNHDVRIEVNNDYKDWVTKYEKGDFSVYQYINNMGPIRLKKSKVTKILLKPSDMDTPSLFFKTVFQPREQILGIYKNRHPEGEYLCLNFSQIIPKKEEYIKPGTYTFFKGEIGLGQYTDVENEPESGQSVELALDNLKVKFEGGGAKLSWKGKELTSGLGLYSSLRSLGIWHDSYQATWEVVSQDNKKMIVSGMWPHIPISQIWQIELCNSNSFSLKVDMEIYEEGEFEIEQVNLMLSSQYKSWKIPGSSFGEFLNEYTHNYDILPFRFWYGKLEKSGFKAEGKDLPKVSFLCTSCDEGLRMIVENTDYLYKARLLQYQRESILCKQSLKKYCCFSGVIRIE